MLTVQRYGNMSAATVPVALTEAVESGRVKPGSLILMPAFGAGLSLCAHLVRWGDRVTPLGESTLQMPPVTQSAIEMVNAVRATQDPGGRSRAGLADPHLPVALHAKEHAWELEAFRRILAKACDEDARLRHPSVADLEADLIALDEQLTPDRPS